MSAQSNTAAYEYIKAAYADRRALALAIRGSDPIANIKKNTYRKVSLPPRLALFAIPDFVDGSKLRESGETHHRLHSRYFMTGVGGIDHQHT